MDNKWVGYIDRSYQQIKDRILTKLALEVPEISDHNESNIFVKLVSIWAGLMEMLGYYLDNRAREMNIMTCRLFKSAIYLSRIHDYRAKASRGSTVELLFEFDQPSTGPGGGSIPIGTIVEATNGTKFVTTKFYQIPFGEKTALVSAEEVLDTVTEIVGTGNGQPNQEIELLILGYKDLSGTIMINGQAWTSQETLGYSNMLDQHFVQTINSNGNPCLIFGDGLNGKIVPVGQQIQLTYKLCSGSKGNLSRNTITGPIQNLPLPVGVSSCSVTNPEAASGGADIETLEEIRYRLPRSKRTKLRAISKQDFVDLAELVDGVARAGADFDCSKQIEVLIIPEGGGVATTQLCTDVHVYIGDKKPIGRYFGVKPAGELGFIFDVSVQVKPTYSNLTVASNVKKAIAEICSYKKQKIGGSLQISDLYTAIDEVVGVDYSDITKMASIPYATPFDNSIALNWTRTLKSGSTGTLKWRIIIASATTFQLLKNDQYVGTYSIGSLVSFPEIDFTILASAYTIGHQWSFYTYIYNDTVFLQEQSVPTVLLSNINIIATGGV